MAEKNLQLINQRGSNPPLTTNNQIKMKIGTNVIYGCDIVEIISIVVNGFVNVKMTHPRDNEKIITIHISQIELVY